MLSKNGEALSGFRINEKPGSVEGPQVLLPKFTNTEFWAKTILPANNKRNNNLENSAVKLFFILTRNFEYNAKVSDA